MTNDEAINILSEMPISTMSDMTFEDIVDALNLAIEALKNERPKGEWIKVMPDERGYTDIFKCSACLCNVQTSYWGKECEHDYCPNCGADMREGEK